jgi:glycerophosphoryl diester phosphodiesterase
MTGPPGFDVQGHRGARGLAPENTLPAFRCALELGVTTLELDLAVSADREVVVSHEPWMSAAICRLPDGRPIHEEEEREFKLFEMAYDEIAAFDCGSAGNPRFPEQQAQKSRKPLLREVFELGEAHASKTGRPVFYNVETKTRPDGDGLLHPEPEAFVRLIAAEANRAGTGHRTTLQSFDVRTLQVADRLDLPFRLALLIAQGDREPLDAFYAGLDQLGFASEIYSPDYRLITEDVIAEATARGMQVIPWTVNEPADMRRLHALGTHGLITDYPDRALEIGF